MNWKRGKKMANMNGVGLFWNSTNWAFNCL